MESVSDRLALVGKGVLIGCAELIPSVSGGTIALLTGIWTQLVLCLARFGRDSLSMLMRGEFKGFWRAHNMELLGLVLIGSLIGLFALARVVHFVLEHQPKALMALIFGVILGSTPRMLTSLGKGIWRRNLPLLLAGGLCGMLMGLLPTNALSAGIPLMFLSAALASCAALLPGLSGAYILLIIGVYDEAVRAVAEFDLVPLLAIAAGVLCGLLSFARLIRKLLASHALQTMLVLIGLVLGSLWKIAPKGFDMSGFWGFAQSVDAALPIGTCLLLVLLGLLAGYALARDAGDFRMVE